MKYLFTLLAGSILTSTVALSAGAPTTPPPVKLDSYNVVGNKAAMSPETSFDRLIVIEIKNLQDETLGRIKDLGIDLINGRIVEVLVESDAALGVDGKIVAVPPGALIPDTVNRVYRLNVSSEKFKQAAAIDLATWTDYGRSDRVAAAYKLFGEEPYFLEDDDLASTTAARPMVRLGYVERASKITDMPVGNHQAVQFGKVWSLTMDIPNGRILSVIVITPGNFLTKSVIPAMALSFNDKRDALLLDETKLEYSDEPRYIFTAAAFGQEAYSTEEHYKGPRTTIALEQGRSYRDLDQTININRQIAAAHINARNIEVGTINDRVTLRGWVDTIEDKRRIGEIAITAARAELVDNQITVGQPVTPSAPISGN